MYQFHIFQASHTKWFTEYISKLDTADMKIMCSILWWGQQKTEITKIQYELKKWHNLRYELTPHFLLLWTPPTSSSSSHCQRDQLRQDSWLKNSLQNHAQPSNKQCRRSSKKMWCVQSALLFGYSLRQQCHLTTYECCNAPSATNATKA